MPLSNPVNRRRFLAAGLASQTLAQTLPAYHNWRSVPKVTNRVAEACQPVAFGAQWLDPASYLGNRVAINYRKGLLQIIDYEEYLRGYGKQPRMPPGEYLGKFTQALSRMYLATGDQAARERMDLILHTWLTTQSADGWLGSFHRFQGWDIWEHKYVLLGLLDYYALTGTSTALEAAEKVAGLLCAHLGPGLGNILQSGYWAMGSASILEPMVYLYRYTAEPKYLRFCDYILEALEGPTGPGLIRTLTSGSGRVCDIEDPWATRAAREIRFGNSGQIRNRSKAYEMLSCMIGITRMYQLTGRSEYLKASINAWNDIAARRLYISGSSGADECFKDDHCLPAETTDSPAEACITAHWMYLSRILFELLGEPRYADAIENSLYNHLLASQRPQDCYQSYNTPLNGTKSLQRPTIWGGKPPCCISSTMREIARTAESVWTRFRNDGVGVLLYTQAEMEDTVQSPGGPLCLRLEMHTAFPQSGTVRLRLRPARQQRFRIALRVPSWATRFRAEVGSHTYPGRPGHFLNLDREWRNGDTITISMELQERLVSGGPSYPGHFAFLRGPQVLTLVRAGDSRAPLPNVACRPGVAPQLIAVSDKLPAGWIGSQAYRSPALENADDCLLVPFGDSSQPMISRQFRTWIPVQPGPESRRPAAPRDLRAELSSPDRIRLSWRRRGPSEGFRIERKRSDVDLWFHVKSTASGVTECFDGPANVVLSGKTYHYRVCAFNESGTSDYCEEVEITTPALPIPGAPFDFRARPVSATQIELSWKSPSVQRAGFQIERKESGGATWRLIASRIPEAVHTFRDFALSPGARYHYRIRAFQTDVVSAWSEEVTATTYSE